MEKICRECGVSKPLEEYHVYKAQKDGRAIRCKECVNRIHREKTQLKKEFTALELCDNDEDRQLAEQILIKLGYELYNKNNPVYKQFQERLNYKK
jgi:hypothetical protein